MSRILIYLFSIILLIILPDQVVKALVIRSNFTFSCNHGFAFGIGQGIESGLISAFVLTIVFYFLIYELRSTTSNTNKIFAMSLILGGGLSNLVDRLVRGCVIDFIRWSTLNELPMPNWLQSTLASWPAFNLADAAITVGVGVIIFSLLTNFKSSFPNDR